MALRGLTLDGLDVELLFAAAPDLLARLRWVASVEGLPAERAERARLLAVALHDHAGCVSATAQVVSGSGGASSPHVLERPTRDVAEELGVTSSWVRELSERLALDDAGLARRTSAGWLFTDGAVDRLRVAVAAGKVA